MKTRIHEIGVIDKFGQKHPVFFKDGLNVVTGKSSTGKSALIEIFDYCFGSSEYTVPVGVITENADIYYVCLQVNEQHVTLGRLAKERNKAFYRSGDSHNSDNITADYFSSSYFIRKELYLKHVRSLFLDIEDVDESLEARSFRANNAKAATPSIRSFTSFMLQHQNLVANKHALFYRFDEKAKRDQVLEHTKIFLGLVDQQFFLLSQEKERHSAQLNALKREEKSAAKVADRSKYVIAPLLQQLYATMGLKEYPLTVQAALYAPGDAIDRLNKIVTSENISHNSDESAKHYEKLTAERDRKSAKLRKLQKKASSIKKHIEEEARFVENSKKLRVQESIQLATAVCPFCHTKQEHLEHNAKQLQQAIVKVSSNLAHAKPMKAKFESSLAEVKQEIEELNKEVSRLNELIKQSKLIDERLEKQQSLYESALDIKVRLCLRLETLILSGDDDLKKRIEETQSELTRVESVLRKYNVQEGLEEASRTVNEYMEEIGQHFEFEKTYKPTRLRFSFETFDLYHLDINEKKGERIYLRSMGSGANWLYSHVTLFLALHQYFAELGDSCSIPSVLFLDQPTQVYFPSFKFDQSEAFDKDEIEALEHRTQDQRPVDEDMKAVENLFSQLSIYCSKLKESCGFTPQIIITDHADDLKLSDGVSFESLVNGNRWRTRGLIRGK